MPTTSKQEAVSVLQTLVGGIQDPTRITIETAKGFTKEQIHDMENASREICPDKTRVKDIPDEITRKLVQAANRILNLSRNYR